MVKTRLWKLLTVLMTIILSIFTPTVSAATSSGDLYAPQDIKGGSFHSESVYMNWGEVEGADGYIVYKYNIKTKKYEKELSTVYNSCLVSGLRGNKTYYFKLAAYKNTGRKKITGKKSDKIALKTVSSKVPKLPEPEKYGFGSVYKRSDDTSSQLRKMIKSTPGLMLGFDTPDTSRGYTVEASASFIEESTDHFNKYFSTLEKKGFELINKGENVVPSENGYTLQYSYEIKYDGKKITNMFYGIDMSSDGNSKDGMICDWCMLMIIPSFE